MSGPYDDIINLPHHVSERHPQMTRIARAAQFSPFAALTGYNSVIKEAARLTDEKIELDDESADTLNRRLNMIMERLPDSPQVNITYFKADERKSGGEYVSVSGAVRAIDMYRRRLILTDGTEIPTDDVCSIDFCKDCLENGNTV